MTDNYDPPQAKPRYDWDGSSPTSAKSDVMQEPLETIQPSVIPEYGTSITPKQTDGDPTLPQGAALFSALPIVLASLTLILLLETHAMFFKCGMVIVIAFGPVFLGIAVLFLLAHLGLMSGPHRFRRFLRTSRLAILLLILNIPATAGIILLAIKYGQF